MNEETSAAYDEIDGMPILGTLLTCMLLDV